jgi:hypothetical protein
MTAGGTTHPSSQDQGQGQGQGQSGPGLGSGTSRGAAPRERGAGEIHQRGAGVVAHSRWTELRAALGWCLRSWRRPADDAARWEQ